MKYEVAKLAANAVCSAIGTDGLVAHYLGHEVTDNKSGDAMCVANFILVERPGERDRFLITLYSKWQYDTYVRPVADDEVLGGVSSRDRWGSYSFHDDSPDAVGECMPTPGQVFGAARLYLGGLRKDFPNFFRLGRDFTLEEEKGMDWTWAP